MSNLPGLFGIKHANKDFSKARNWGKNTFNNAFPIALACYMQSQSISPIYLKLNDMGTLDKSNIDVVDLLGGNPLKDELFFAFESVYTPYQTLITEQLPRIDLITMDRKSSQIRRGIELKLTALPDDTTHALNENQYGCENAI